jgi:hypothetical protein
MREPLANVLAQLVSQEQVDASRNKAILWGLFAALMLVVVIVKIARMGSKKDKD